jgi:hypothetical protein
MVQHRLPRQVLPPRPLVFSSILLLSTMAIGLLVRFAPVGLPLVLVKYGG